MLATPKIWANEPTLLVNTARSRSSGNVRLGRMLKNVVSPFGAFALLLTVLSPAPSRAEDTIRYLAKARAAYRDAQKAYTNSSNSLELAYDFARACFDYGDMAESNSERAQIAEQGIAACQKVLQRNPDSAAAHYYLGMNQGELARTRGIGALKLVLLMEAEFKKAAELDEKFDYAGPNRNLGLLYRDAPHLGSIGSRTKAHKNLERAVELAADYPENRLNLLESCLQWSDRNGAKREFAALLELWPKAQKDFNGPKWEYAWYDWNKRFDAVKKKMGEPSKAIESPRAKD
jgi:tetratricopeptide (TPR) repeat protein